MQKYTFLILFVISALWANAQINYTDIIPDINLTGSDTCFIDLDADGIDDLKFTQEDSITNLNANGIGVTLLHNNVEFIGDNPSYDPSHLYPFKVDSNNIIDTNADNRQWVVKLGGNDVIRVMHIHFFGGADIGEWAPALSKTYLGIRIKIAAKWHYGWVRIDASTTDATHLIINDFAINMQEEEKIYAGQKQDFGPSAVAVSFEDSLCGVVVGFARRNTSPSLQYNIVYKEMLWGTYDSIYAIYPKQASYYLDTDPLVSNYQFNYRISAVDSIKGESLLSDTAFSSFLYTDSAATGNIRLNYKSFRGLEIANYSFFHRLDSIYQVLPFDSILSLDTTYLDTQKNWANDCYNYYARCVLAQPLNIPGYGVMDTLNSNPASNYPLQIFNPKAEFDASVPVGGGSPMTVIFTDQSRASITNWYWEFGDGSTSKEQNPSHAYVTTGTYDVRLSIANCFGMDVIKKIDLITVGINSIEQQTKCKLFPNPSTGLFTIELSLNQEIQSIKVIDVRGSQILFYNGLAQSKFQIDLSSFPKGFYYMEIVSEKKIVYRKLILE